MGLGALWKIVLSKHSLSQSKTLWCKAKSTYQQHPETLQPIGHVLAESREVCCSVNRVHISDSFQKSWMLCSLV